jgi:hypothetical protein
MQGEDNGYDPLLKNSVCWGVTPCPVCSLLHKCLLPVVALQYLMMVERCAETSAHFSQAAIYGFRETATL